MNNLNDYISTLIRLQKDGEDQVTLLAVCPNSASVLEAAVKAAVANQTPMLFAATLNQVDCDGGYTGWTPAQFVTQVQSFARRYGWNGPLFPCLDHGGPWLKDRHTLDRLSLEETMQRVKDSLEACVQAGYQLLHIDPTVDRRLPAGQTVSLEDVVARTVELIAYAEKVRQGLHLPPIAYEVGTEEVHGGLVDYARFEQFLIKLRTGLEEAGLMHAWPCFIVAQVGTDLHTTYFDPVAARRLYSSLSLLGSLAKGHYTDWVENPAEYPRTGMGGANVGPEFTAVEYLALQDLVSKEIVLCRRQPGKMPSNFMQTLEEAVIDSRRWKKWLQPDEQGKDFRELSSQRRLWLAQTGARYIWTHPAVQAARQQLFTNLEPAMSNPHEYVVDRIVSSIDRYINAFSLFGSLNLFENEHPRS
jgi:D-tagatose-1,6-bisphosphate aldolase subunit GatZ/KbaZ